MTTFSQWNRTRPLRQLTWVCGPEWVLRRKVVEHYIASLPDVPKLHWWFDAFSEGPIWDYLLSTPPDRGRLGIIQAAQETSMPDRFALLAQTLPELSYVVFVSSEADFARAESKPGKRQSGPKPLAPHLAAIRGFRDSQLIRCCRPSKDEELLKLVASWWPGAGSNWAQQVWDRCRQDLTAAWQACDTAARAGLEPGIPDHLDMACQGIPGEAFATLLISGHADRAMTEARSFLGPQDSLAAIGLLNYKLTQIRSYAAQLGRGLGTDEIARQGISRYVQHELAPHVSRYTPERELGCRRVLAMAEEALRSGSRAGVLEAVATLWLRAQPVNPYHGHEQCDLERVLPRLDQLARQPERR